jgi:hypothetical protein
MSRRHYSSTAAATTLTASISDSDTSITVAAVTGFPTSYPYTLIIDFDTTDEEIVEVTAGSSTTLTVTRGVDGTTGKSHSSGAGVRHGVSARDFNDVNNYFDATAALQTLTGQFYV